MSGNSLESKNKGQAIQSGPEVLAEFIGKISTDGSLDTAVVDAIVHLYKANKLTTINLQKLLDSARAGGH
jgi:hypothetical protein